MRHLIAVTLAATLATPGLAEPLSGERQIIFVDGEGNRHTAGRVAFTPQGNQTSYSISWTPSAFEDHFLSMRPFRCMEGPAKLWCHVPYPYPINRTISGDDLTDLEYDLLFVWKGASDYGINMWNGVYYQLEATETGLAGHLHEMNMDVLSAPPPDGSLRPVKAGDLHQVDPGGHWLPRVLIE